MTTLPLRVSAEVSDAIASATGVVALESTLISHGLPTESAAATTRAVEQEVRRAGAVPATIAVLDGVVRVGLDDDGLGRVAEDPRVAKESTRDLAVLLARKASGATTVAATSYLAHLAGIRVFATGGPGGVHRGARESWDESADLGALAAVPVTVVCAGAKSVLDVPATLERLETLSVPVLGYGCDVFPGVLRPRHRRRRPVAGRRPGRGARGDGAPRPARAAPGHRGGEARPCGRRAGPGVARRHLGVRANAAVAARIAAGAEPGA